MLPKIDNKYTDDHGNTAVIQAVDIPNKVVAVQLTFSMPIQNTGYDGHFAKQYKIVKYGTSNPSADFTLAGPVTVLFKFDVLRHDKVTNVTV